jgi:curved DNA-binding protein
MIDPYKILGIPQTATDDAIKKAYRTLAKEHHPDRTKGDDTKFKEIAEAYEILSDPKKKAQWNTQSRFAGGGFDEQFFEDFLKNQGFSGMFNNRYGWADNGKGQDIKTQIQISLEDAYYGVNREMRIGMKPISVTIPRGIRNGQRLRLKGLGQRGLTEELHGDLILTVVVGDHSDYMIDNRGLHKIHRVDVFDAMLGGKGIIDIFDKKISFTIPPNTQNGTLLRIQGKGFPLYNQNDACGDLYINILVELPKSLTDSERELLSQIKKSIDGRQ